MAKAAVQSDPSVRIPSAVKNAQKLSEEAYKAAYPQDEQPDDQKPKDKQPDDQQPSDQQPSDQQPDDQQPQDEQPDDQRQPEQPDTEQKWEQRYKSLKGRHDAAVEELRTMRGTVAELRSVVTQLRDRMDAQDEDDDDDDDDVDLSSILTPEEREEYGPEFINLVGRTAKAMTEREFSKMSKELAALRGEIAPVKEATAKASRAGVYAALDAQIPQWGTDWREINKSDEFKEWLLLQDPFSGVIRQELLANAFERFDANRVVAIFDGFVRQTAATTREPEGGLPGDKPAKVPLKSLAAPGRAAPAAPSDKTPADSKPTVKQSQIAAFYAAVASGKYKGREEQRQADEALIFEATRDGRVVAG